MVMATLPLLFIANYHEAVLWVCSVAFGLGMSTFYCCLFSWLDARLGVTGKVASAITFFGSAGYIAGPFLTGTLISTLGAVSFIHIVETNSFLLLITFVTTQIILKRCVNGDRVKEEQFI